MRFGERRKWKVEVLDEQRGEEAGVKSVSMAIEGVFAYGYLKHEKGTHRLVRQSPFNADKLRQTSFALVEVMPDLPEDAQEVSVNLSEIEIEFFRSAGAGGQNVNKVSTAVRIRHLPSGIVVSCQTQRFQHQNKETAMKMLRAKLWEIEERKQEEEKAKIKGEYKQASWGNQIRSYVLHPYKMVKDLRTEVASGNPDAVLDGDLEEFVEAEVRQMGGRVYKG